MDAFAVAIATGISLKRVNRRQTFRLAWHFGLFQMFMPIIGWHVGRAVYRLIEKFDHWIAFLLLFFISFRMIVHAVQSPDGKIQIHDPTKGGTMVMLSVATSIDALAVGLSISMLQITIWKPALIIGIVALSFTAIGLHIGQIVGVNFNLGKYAEMMGGVVLFGIGLRILYLHL